MPEVIERPIVHLVLMLSRSHAAPAARAILELAPLVASAMELPVTQPAQTSGGGSAPALGKEVAGQEGGARRGVCVAILVGTAPAAKAHAKDAGEKLLGVAHQLDCVLGIGHLPLPLAHVIWQHQLDGRHVQELLDHTLDERIATDAERNIA